MKVLITGGSGFIGSALCRHLIANTHLSLVNLDALTYAADQRALASIEEHPNYQFIHGNICDRALTEQVLERNDIKAIIHLAAESHVDRSIDAPDIFMQTNIMGTYSLLEATRVYLDKKPASFRQDFTFLHVSTDEVYGDLGDKASVSAFDETAPYNPSSPYSASKAASDQLVKAWARTYDLDARITISSNNYGPYQFPEKLIPFMLTQALKGNPLPVYGDGQNIRDWLYVDDHALALESVLLHGKAGETYNIYGNAARRNIEVVQSICDLLDDLKPREDGNSYREQIAFVSDRAGHDRWYAINSDKISNTLNWQPKNTFEDGLRETILWYLDNLDWWEPL